MTASGIRGGLLPIDGACIDDVEGRTAGTLGMEDRTAGMAVRLMRWLAKPSTAATRKRKMERWSPLLWACAQ